MDMKRHISNVQYAFSWSCRSIRERSEVARLGRGSYVI